MFLITYRQQLSFKSCFFICIIWFQLYIPPCGPQSPGFLWPLWTQHWPSEKAITETWGSWLLRNLAGYLIKGSHFKLLNGPSVASWLMIFYDINLCVLVIDCQNYACNFLAWPLYRMHNMSSTHVTFKPRPSWIYPEWSLCRYVTIRELSSQSQNLTHWDRDKMAAISQTTHSNTFC